MNKGKVRGYRNMLGLTQAQLGERLGMTKQTYHNKEVGKNAFTDEEKRNFKELLLPNSPISLLTIYFFKAKVCKSKQKGLAVAKLTSL